MNYSVSLVLAVLISEGCAPQLVTNVVPQSVPAAAGTEVRVLDSHLLSQIRDLEGQSALLHAALDSIRAGNIRIWVGTPEELRSPVPWCPPMRADHVGEVASRTDPATGTVLEIAVQVDLKKVAQQRWQHVPSPRTWFSARLRQQRFDQDVAAVLIHELWGHLVPIAMSGNIASWCADPTPGEPDLQSCVMRRENALRAELTLPARKSYVLHGSW